MICPQCGAGFEPQEGRPGRPQVYCSATCRRAREYAIKRAQRAVERAERELTDQRARVADGWWHRAEELEAFWVAEVDRTRAALEALL